MLTLLAIFVLYVLIGSLLFWKWMLDKGCTSRGIWFIMPIFTPAWFIGIYLYAAMYMILHPRETIYRFSAKGRAENKKTEAAVASLFEESRRTWDQTIRITPATEEQLRFLEWLHDDTPTDAGEANGSKRESTD
jgi:hypothetical protein